MKPVLIDLFCKAGGATRGYMDAGFYVIGVDIKPQKHYIGDEFHQADAMTFDLSGADVCGVHASPPCQRYSRCNTKYRDNHPDLIEAVRGKLVKAGKPYIIENVEDARPKLINPIMLCGSMFGLPILRHRLFELSWGWALTPSCNHPDNPVYITGTPRPKDGSPRKDPPAKTKREALQTPWMTIAEMDEAIPPAYTEFIGKQLMHFLTNAIVFAAKDAALVPALEAYLQECQRLGCNQEHLDSIGLLIGRVRHFQGNIEKRLPDTTGECEVTRCLKGQV